MPSDDEIYDAEATLRFEEYMNRQDEVHEAAANTLENNHPITVEDIDVCNLAEALSKNPKSENLKSICDDFPKGGLKTLAIQLGEELPNRAGRRIIANAIIRNINTKCTECKNTLVTV